MDHSRRPRRRHPRSPRSIAPPPEEAALHISRLALAFFCLQAATVQATDTLPATTILANFQQTLHAEKSRNDWPAYRATAQQLATFLNAAPLSQLEIARADLNLGHTAAALAETRIFLAMGQTHPMLQAALFHPLIQTLQSTIAATEKPQRHSTTFFTIDDTHLLLEDIDADPGQHRFYVTSILKTEILILQPAQDPTIFATAPDHWPMLALKLDLPRRRLWATEVALDGFSAIPAAAWGKSAVLQYNLDTRRLISRTPAPPHTNLADMTLATNGDPILSDGDGGGIYRLHNNQFRRLDHGNFISPQTIAFCAGETHAFVPDYVRGLAILNLTTGQATWMDPQNQYALDGIDGLYCRGQSLFATRNSAQPERVTEFKLDSTRTKITAQTIIDSSMAGDITHGVLLGPDFYYLANAGWNSIGDNGQPKPNAQAQQAEIRRAASIPNSPAAAPQSPAR